MLVLLSDLNEVNYKLINEMKFFSVNFKIDKDTNKKQKTKGMVNMNNGVVWTKCLACIKAIYHYKWLRWLVQMRSNNVVGSKMLDRKNIKSFACIQGAREFNEDFAFSTEICKSDNDSIENKSVDVDDNSHTNKGEEGVAVFGVFDGHSGKHAALVAKGLATVMLDNAKRTSDEEMLCEENVEDQLSSFYETANTLLRNEESGVVSIIAVVFKRSKRVVFGWLGDCEGCVFVDDPCCFSSPVHKSVDLITQVDYAELKCEIDSRVGNTLKSLPKSLHERRLYAKTIPHHLGNSVVVNAPWQYSVHNSEAFYGFCASDVQAFASRVLPLYFTNKDDQHEYDMLAKQAFCKGNDNSCVLLDVTKIKIGDTVQILDTRVSGAIQPTRSLGDHSEVNHNIIRDCCVMSIRGLSLPVTGIKKQYKCLLCSDGMFHFGAFENISKLSSFFIDPFRFFKEYFYHMNQEVTIRMIAIKLLPPKKYVFESIQHDSERVAWTMYEHAVHWQNCKRSWASVIYFLGTYHMKAICSSAFRNTYSFVSVRSLEDWLLACEISMKWFQENIQSLELYAPAPTYFDDVLTKMEKDSSMKDALLCHAAVHFAVLMGSQDNSTVLVSSV